MNATERELLVRMLAGGRLCTAEDLAGASELEPDAVDLAMMALRDLGLEIEEVAGAGYRLGGPLDVLDANEIVSRLEPDMARRVESVEVESVLTSTSDYLAALPPPSPGSARVCLAEYQTRGRGRLRRQWIAPFGSGVCLSMDWTFAQCPEQLTTLGLAVGVAAVDALAGLGASGLALKWPNDVLHERDKLGGILIDGQGTGSGPCRVIIGVGINHHLPPATRAEILALGNRATDLVSVCGDEAPARNDVAAAIVNALTDLLPRFEAEGFGIWARRWRAVDGTLGRAVRVDLADGPLEGIADGIDETGALLVRSASGVHRVIAGEVMVSGVRTTAD